MTADQIVRLLAEKHGKDVFVSECKDGCSWGGHLRMDAWAMAKSWAHPCMYGYEVKVSRSDFLGDDKWPGYLLLCNRFSFVAPRGIIQPSELSEGVGLLEVASTGTSLRTIRKSAYRQIEPPAELLKYILMCRAKIVAPRFSHMEDGDHGAFWRQWLKDKQDARDIGHMVSRRLRKLIAEQIETVKCENRRLVAENEDYAEIKAMLAELKLSPGSWYTKDKIKKLAAEYRAGIPQQTRETLMLAKRAIDELVSEIQDKELAAAGAVEVSDA